MAYRKLPTIPLKGMNLIGTYEQQIRGVTTPSGGDTDYHGMNVVPGWIEFLTTEVGGWHWQVDLAKSAGCNVVRIMCDGGGSCFLKLWEPAGTYASNLALYLEAVRKVIRYCHSVGMYAYPNLNCCYQNGATGDSDIASFTASFCEAIAAFPNVIGVDVMQEFNLMTVLGTNSYNSGNPATNIDAATKLSRADAETRLRAVMTACRAAAPNLALTASFQESNDSSAMFSATSVGNNASLFDYLDFHIYYNVLSGESQAIYSQSGTDGKQIIIGEHGQNMSVGQAAQQTRWSNVLNNVVSETYGSQPGCHGLMWWAIHPQNTPDGSDDWGAWSANGTPRAVATNIAAHPAIPIPIRFPRRRKAI